MNNKAFYSTNALLAQIITERFFDNCYYVWCATEFDINPPSSNPKEIFVRLHNDVKKSDNHSSKMQQCKAGLIKAVLKKKKAGLLNDQDSLEALSIIRAAEIKHFKPLLYIIPSHYAKNATKPKVNQRADILSNEFIIEKLQKEHFDILQS